MGYPVESFPVEWHRILRQHQMLLGGLDQEYRKSRPDRPIGEFRQRIIDELKILMPSILLENDIDKKKLCEFIELRGDGVIDSDIAWIYFSCAYALASELAVTGGDLDLGWQFQCQAHLHYGLAASTDRSEKIFNKVVVAEYQKGLAGLGGGGKSDLLYGKYRERAIEILRSKKWISLGKAKGDIIEALEREFPKERDEKGKEIAAYQPSTVITWLKTLPEEELDGLIPSYKAFRESSKAAAAKRKTRRRADLRSTPLSGRVK
jgi:hypothetical protein